MRTRMAMRKVLVVAAHADDEVLGMGGTMARHSREGDEVTVYFMTDGVGSRGASKAAVAARADASTAASKVLGTKVIGNAGFPDNALDSVPLLAVVKEIERVAALVGPDLVYTHFHGDLNVDHGLTCRAVLTALRPLPDTPVIEIRAFEVLSSTEWAVAEQFHPDTYVDVSGVVELLLEAYDCYAQEQPADPHARSRIALLHKLGARGRVVGLDSAEAFTTLRRIVRVGNRV